MRKLPSSNGGVTLDRINKMLWLTSDNHYFHNNVIKYSSRPFADVQEMNETLIKNWNAVVKPNDEVWDLGDFSFGNYMQTCAILSRLNGKHHFVMGNHDKIIAQNKQDLLKSKLLHSIQDYKELKYNGNNIVLFHFPMRTWNRAHHNSILCHGHCHGNIDMWGKSVDIGVDAKFIHSEYRPTSLDEIIEFMNKVPVKIVDHHDGSRM
jgi:calcineurin-like phosphoesterase family protein